MTPVYVLKGTYRWNNTLTRIPIENPMGLDFESTIVDGATTTKFTFNRLQNSGDYIQFYVTKVNNSTEDSRVDTFINVYNLSTNRWEWELQDFTVIYPMTYDETLGNWFNNNTTAISVEPEPDEPEEPDTPTETKTIKKGTYRFNETLTDGLPHIPFELPFSYTGDNDGTIATVNFSSIFRDSDAGGYLKFYAVNIVVDGEIVEELNTFYDIYTYNPNAAMPWEQEFYVITVREDTTYTDEDGVDFVNWFNTNTKPVSSGGDTPGTPDTPDTDITVDSLIAKLQNLINKANTITGKSNTDITSSMCSLIAGYGQGGGSSADCDGCIIEVEELPTENIDKDVLYMIKGQSICVDAALGALIPSFRAAMEADGIPFDVINVDELPTENIMETIEGVQTYIYYVRNTNKLYAYENGTWLSYSDNPDFPVTPIMGKSSDLYCKWIEEFKDVLLSYNGTVISYINMMASEGISFGLYYAKTRPTDNVEISTQEMMHLYYVEDEDAVLAYGDLEESGTNAWISLTEGENFPYGGAITDKSQVTAELTLYALVKNGWDKYTLPTPLKLQNKIATSNGEYTADEGYDGLLKVTVDVPNEIPDGYIKPSGNLEITKNGTYDVTEKASVTVDVESESTGGDAIIQVDNIGARYGFKVDLGDIALPYATPQINNIQIEEA